MKITKQELIDLDAWEIGLERFIEQTSNTDEPIDVASLVGGLNTDRDVVWLACKKLPRSRIIRLTCDCALINIELIKPYTDKYDLIVDFLKNPDKYSRRDMLAVRSASYSATYSFIGDYGAAYSAAYSTANAVSYFMFYATVNAVNAAAFAAKISPDAVNKLLVDTFNGDVPWK